MFSHTQIWLKSETGLSLTIWLRSKTTDIEKWSLNLYVRIWSGRRCLSCVRITSFVEMSFLAPVREVSKGERKTYGTERYITYVRRRCLQPSADTRGGDPKEGTDNRSFTKWCELDDVSSPDKSHLMVSADNKVAKEDVSLLLPLLRGHARCWGQVGQMSLSTLWGLLDNMG